MQIIKDAITTLAGEGYMTLQVPVYDLGAPPQTINVPDSWLCYIKSNNSLCIGKQRGFLYLTEEGFKANYRDIKKAFEGAIANGMDRTGGVGWPAFEQYVRDHFADVKARRATLIAKKQKEIAELQALTV